MIEPAHRCSDNGGPTVHTYHTYSIVVLYNMVVLYSRDLPKSIKMLQVEVFYMMKKYNYKRVLVYNRVSSYSIKLRQPFQKYEYDRGGSRGVSEVSGNRSRLD